MVAHELTVAELVGLVGGFAHLVRRVGARYGLAVADLEDLVQDVRIRLWQALPPRGQITGGPASYGYRTAVSSAIDMIRRRRARHEETLDPERPWQETRLPSLPGPEAALEEEDLANLVEHEVSALADSRALVIRMYLAGYGREEIAARLGWSEPRTRHLLYRGLADLRGRLRARGILGEIEPKGTG